MEQKSNSLATQVGGSHYKDMKIQPVEFIHANNIPFIEGACIKYLCRHRNKNRAEDLRKVIHFCEMLIELEYGEEERPFELETDEDGNALLDEAMSSRTGTKGGLIETSTVKNVMKSLEDIKNDFKEFIK